MIIIEGADNVGKTTLVKEMLALDPTLRLLYRPRFKPSAGETIATSYLNALLPPDGDHFRHSHSIADRFFASECVYGMRLRGGCRMTANEHLMIRGLLDRYNATVIFCDPPDDAIRASWSAREQLYSLEQTLQIAADYRQRVGEIFFGTPVVRYDWTHPQAPGLRQILVDSHLESATRRLNMVSSCRLPGVRA